MVLASFPAILSGCTGYWSTSSDKTPTETPSETGTATSAESPTDSPTPEPKYSLIPTDSKSTAQSEVRANLSGRDCSGLTNEPAVCPGDDARLSVSVSTDVASLPEATVEITVRNDADEEYEFNRYDWKLYKYDGGAWQFLAPLTAPEPLRNVPPGETEAYRVTTERPDDEGSRSMKTRVLESRLGPISAPGLGPGVYGFVNASGFFSEDDPLGFGATFGLSGEGPEIRPSDAVESVERDGGTLIVHGGADEWEPKGFEVSFTDEGAATLLPEHVQLLDPLRNTLSYAATEGVDAIRYVTDGPDVNWALRYLDAVTPDGTSSYRFRDYRFEVEKTAP